MQKHQKKMFNIAIRITGNYDVAAETVQDAFVAASRDIDSFRGTARFVTWLAGITVDQARHRSGPLLYEEGEEDFVIRTEAPDTGSGIFAGQTSETPLAREDVNRLLAQDRLQGCLNMLPAEFREAIVLRDMQGFTCEEMSAMLKIREGTIKSRVSHAREMLKDCLKSGAGANR